jgi:hypothetical protein
MIDVIEPFLGRMVIEVIKEDSDEYLKKKLQSETGVSNEFLNKLEIVRGDIVIDDKTGREVFKKTTGKVPYSKGKIVKKSPDAFGKCFQDRYGDEMQFPDIGDIVFFIPNQTYRIDVDDKYHLISDCDIVAFKKG